MPNIPLRKSAWTAKAEQGFHTVKYAFPETPILRHLEPVKLTVPQTDVCAIPVAGILTQYNGFGMMWVLIV